MQPPPAHREVLPLEAAIELGKSDLEEQIDADDVLPVEHYRLAALTQFSRVSFPPWEIAFVVVCFEEKWNYENVRIRRFIASGPFRESDVALRHANEHPGPAAIVGPVKVSELR